MSTIGTSIGPYRVSSLLGCGGAGSVYRAQDGRTGVMVALKTLERPIAAFLPTIRREISALARLDHPGIVRILDSGVRDGVPWYAMELVEGVSLLENSRGRSVAEILLRVQRLCAALSYLHGEGLVHRDLKPDNVLVRSGDRPVLVDFGLAVSSAAAHSREAVETDLGPSGTLLYMAPEQLRGELVDARADLYSLGCVLYELLTGHPPFRSTSAAELVQSHLHVPPQPPSACGRALPQEIDALVLQLLAKDPRERLGYADVVAAALAAHASPDEETALRPRPYLYRPAMAGREVPLQQLELHLERLAARSGALVLVGGESGVGKSRLALELARRAERRRLRVLAGECLPAAASPGAPSATSGSGQGPLHPLRRPLQAIADRCRGRGKAETARLLGRRGKLLAPYESALQRLPGQDVHPEPAELPPAAARLRLYEALSETLLAMAADAPLLLLLDDLQWADGLTLGWLEHLVRGARLQRLPLLVVGTYRSEERNEELDRLLGDSGVAVVKLERLDEEPIGRIVSDMLALTPPPERFVHFLARQSEGNPFFVAEYLRAAIGEGVLFRDAAGLWQIEAPHGETDPAGVYESLPLPRSLQETVVRRLDALSAEARALVECASVLGREMEQDLLLELARVPEERTWGPLEELVVREILAEPRPGLLRFAHDKLREVAYDCTDPVTRLQAHRRAAEALESRQGRGNPQDPAVLGGHWERAREAVRAYGYYLEGARQRSARFAYAEAETLYRAALGLLPQPDLASIAARIELGSVVLYNLGRNPEGQLELRAAIREAESIGEQVAKVNAFNRLGYLHCMAGQYSESEAVCRSALELARALPDPALEDGLLNVLALTLKVTERFEEAEALYVELAARSPSLRVSAFRHLSDILRGQGRLSEALSRCEEALSEARETGQVSQEGLILGVMGTVYYALGSIEEARKLQQRALDLGRERGDPYLLTTNLINLATSFHQQHRSQEAREHYEQAIELGDRLGFGSTVSIALLNLGVLLEETGQIEEALRSLERACELAREGGRKRTESAVLVVIASIERRSGSTDLALSRLDGARALFPEQDQSLVEVQVQHLCERGHLALVANLPQAAAGHLREAHDVAGRLHGDLQPLVQRRLKTLQHAIATFAAGGRLAHGERWEDIPVGFQSWLIQQGKFEPPFCEPCAGASEASGPVEDDGKISGGASKATV